MKLIIAPRSLLVFMLHSALCLAAFAQGTAFTYQGRLGDGTIPANGIYDLRFTIYDLASGGSIIAGPVTNSPTGVTNGLFAVTLNFGAGVFDGSERWLEIGVRTNGGGVFTALNPRQRITSTPYAIRAASLSGVVSAAGLSGTYTGAVNFTNPSNVFVGDGTGLTNTAAATLGGLSASDFWQLGGNAGTTAGADFLGTIDNQPLELKANGQRAMRLEPAPETPNVLGGSASNSIAPGIRGATIAGGGLPAFPNQVTADFATVGGGTFHVAGGAWSTIAGGRDNRVYSESSGILSGRGNVVESNSLSSVIVGGDGNAIREANTRTFIGAGVFNTIQTDADYSVIVGGRFNTNESQAYSSAIGGGATNRVEANATFAVLAGGFNNSVGAGSVAGTVGGGQANRAEANHATVAGGLYNTNIGLGGTIGGGNRNRTVANDTVVAGGFANDLRVNSHSSVIGGGNQNIIEADSHYTTIGGGYFNRAAAPESTVSGGALNQALAFSSTVGGGGGNINSSDWATIAGGRDGSIAAGNEYATIGGGFQNRIQSFSTDSTIGGGRENLISTNASSSTIAGGGANSVGANANSSTVSGGLLNQVGESSLNGVVGGGILNVIGTNSNSATIAGGAGNQIGDNALQPAIGGGTANIIGNIAFNATIAGGQSNRVSNIFGTVSGGQNNTSLGAWATVPGGQDNSAAADYAFAAGRRAKANHAGVLVWADSTDADFASTSSNQFLIRASGGVGINTNNPGPNALSVAGTTQLGSGAGTAQTPDRGLVLRRVRSTVQTLGSVVARTDRLTLERDGTSGGWRIVNTASPGNTTIAATGLSTNGVTITFVTSIASGAAAGTNVVFTSAQNVVSFRCSFGDSYTPGHLTEVSLTRFPTDLYWTGTLTSTYNQ